MNIIDQYNQGIIYKISELKIGDIVTIIEIHEELYNTGGFELINGHTFYEGKLSIVKGNSYQVCAIARCDMHSASNCHSNCKDTQIDIIDETGERLGCCFLTLGNKHGVQLKEE